MQFNKIVPMIDACLERLQAAREILSTSGDTLAMESSRKLPVASSARTRKKVRPAIAAKKIRKDEFTPSLFEQAPVIVAAPLLSLAIEPVLEKTLKTFPVKASVPDRLVVAAPRVRAERPSPPKRVEAVASALVSRVPTGPVFISAAKVQERAEAKVERGIPAKTDSAPLTAESLAKRWIQSTGF